MHRGSQYGPAVVVIDNGGGTCKVGIGGKPTPDRVFPNCTAKSKGEKHSLVADTLLECKDVSQLTVRRPFDRGYLVNWDLEKEIWGRALKATLRVNPRDCGLVMTEPLFNFPQLQAATEQVVFEEFGFQSYYTAPAPNFSLQRCAQLQPANAAARTGCGVVLDAGFSFTHAVPFFEGQVLLGGVKRVNVGGKVLTNFLKELVSFRSFNMMDETYLMESVKDASCFVSQDVRADLKLAAAGLRSPHRREYVLPDGVKHLRGFLRNPAPPRTAAEAAAAAEAAKAAAAAAAAASAADGAEREPGSERGASPPLSKAAATKKAAAADPQEQVLTLNNDRFMVPEVLFHPSDIGLKQAGVAEAIVQAVSACHPALQPLLYSNILLTGGLAACPGFSSRMVAELRPLVPGDVEELHVYSPPDPGLCAWEGMSQFAASHAYREAAMTRAQYQESGGGGGAHVANKQYR